MAAALNIEELGKMLSARFGRPVGVAHTSFSGRRDAPPQWSCDVTCVSCHRKRAYRFEGSCVHDTDFVIDFIANRFTCKCTVARPVAVVVQDQFASQTPAARSAIVARMRNGRPVVYASRTGCELPCCVPPDFSDEEKTNPRIRYPESSAEMNAALFHPYSAGLPLDAEIVRAAFIPAVDPLDRLVDGRTVRDCLELWTDNNRTTDYGMRAAYAPLTPAQKDAARAAWSAELKRRTQESVERERNQVRVDIQDIE